MLKLYEIFTNNGGWGGCHSDYVIAENEEEAKTKSSWYQKYKDSRDVDCHCWERTGDDIIRKLLCLNDGDKYTMSIEIKKKE
jgi:hypothetical protein